MKRATIRADKNSFCISDFNPRPREEGDAVFKKGKLNFGISIHALVKRATYACLPYLQWADISIHALVKRATGLCLWETLANVDFNPRPREEGDQ